MIRVATVRVLILRAPGTNCDLETEYAWETVGARPERVHIDSIAQNPQKLLDYQILTIPGGFSYGDDVAAGRIFAARIERLLWNELREFAASDRLILGICNGFQILARLGLVPFSGAEDRATPTCAVTFNQPAGFQDRWTTLEVATDHCVFLTPGMRFDVPIAHGEGRVVFANDDVRTRVANENLVAVRYVNSAEACYTVGSANPNGSELDAAGLCDASGRIFGLMPHPDRFIDATAHPTWTSHDTTTVQTGTTIFSNALRYFE